MIGFLLALRLFAQQPDSAPGFDLTEAMIPMRDGVKLHTTIFVPRGAHGPLPFVFTRTPYGIAGAGNALRGYYRAFANDGYIFAFQDIRGRYTSEGQFVMMRPPRGRGDSSAVDESTDAYDTIEWLIHRVPNNNGRVGMLGISYPGWLTVMAMLDPHPALKAASPQASPADMFLGDDFHHNGAFRLSYGFEYAAMMETSKEQDNFAFDRYDTYQWYLDLGPLANVNARHLHGKIPTWNDYVAHPNYDWFWQKQAAAPYLTRVTVPTLNVAGWWDQEDFYGPMKIYDLLEPHDTGRVNYLVVLPQASTSRTASSRRGSRISSKIRASCGYRRRSRSRQGRTSGDHGTSGRLGAARPNGRSTSMPVAGFRSSRPLETGRRRSTATCQIRRTPCRTVTGRSSRRILPTARIGTPGSSRTNALSMAAPTSCPGRRNRSPTM